MVFPKQNLPLPHRPFPFDLFAQVLPKKWVPDCHLVRTVIPCLPNYDSLGVFHRKTFRSLASFASMVSRSDNRRCLYTAIYLFGPLSPHVHSRQATLHAATRFCAPPCRFLPGSYASEPRAIGILPPSHNTRSPRKPGRILHAIGVRPESLTPSTHPKLGVKSRHHGLHRYALHRIFRPYLGTGRSD